MLNYTKKEVQKAIKDLQSNLDYLRDMYLKYGYLTFKKHKARINDLQKLHNKMPNEQDQLFASIPEILERFKNLQ